MDADLGRTVPNRIPWKVSRNGVDGMTPSLSDILGTSASPPSGGFWRLGIVNKRQSTFPNFWKSNELDAAVDGNFTNNSIAPPLLDQVFSYKLSNSYSRDLYARYGVHIAIDHVNPVEPQLLTHGSSTANVLNKDAGIWIPATIIRMSPDVTHWSAADCSVVQSSEFGDSVGSK